MDTLPMWSLVALLVTVIVLGTTVWVWFDAKPRDWRGNRFAKGPWWWVIGTLLLWVVVFPVYLFQRGKAPARY